MSWPTIDWVFETMIASTLLMGLVLVIRRPVSDLFGPRIAYLLWLAPALRMVMPPLPADWFGEAASVAAPLPDAVAYLIPIAPAAPAAAGTYVATMDWTGLMLAFWCAGALMFFIGHGLAYADFSRRARHRATGLMDAEGVPVIASALVPSPVALGLWRPQILVPVDFLWRYDATERRLALAHELVHHRRHDLAANVAALAILSIHWWNPVAHIAFRAFRLDQEAACDAVVLAKSDAGERRAYGNALYKSAAGQMPLAVCALGSSSQLKARLRRIAQDRPHRMTIGGIAAALLAIGGGVVATASTSDRAAPAAAASPSPAIVALNGVTIDTGNPDVTSAIAKADRAEAIAARAEAEAGRIEADAGRIEADAARIEADAAAIEADAAGMAASVAAEATRTAAEAARKAAAIARSDARRAVIAASKCDDGRPMKAEVINRGRDDMHVLMCGRKIVDQRKLRAEIAQGLREAREDIARERDMPESIRAQVIASLERQIARLRGPAPAAPEPPEPPLPPAMPDGSASPAPPAPPEISKACPDGTRSIHVVSVRDHHSSKTRISCDGRTVIAAVQR